MRKTRSIQGMTLLELVIYIGVASIALGGIIGLFMLLNQSWSRTRSQSVVDEGLRAAAERLQTEAAAADTVLEPAYRAAVLDDSPIAYWRLDETGLPTARNSSLNGQVLDGTYSVTGVSLDQQGAVSDATSAAAFDGSSGQVAVAANALLDSPGASVELWAKPDVLRTQALIFKNYTNSWRIFMQASGRVEFDALADTVNLVTPADKVLTTASWTHVVGTYDAATQTMRVYLNGQQEGELTGVVSIGGAYSSAVTISPLQGARWDGFMDEVALYNRALTSAEVADHYRHGIGAQLAFNRGTDAPAIYSGYAWAENFGWLSWNCAAQQDPWDCVQGDALFDNYRVTRALDNLSGFAKTEHTGFLSLNCASSSATDACNTSNYRVSVGSDGEYRGWGWGDGLGWVSFNCENTNNCSSPAGDWKVFETATPTGAELHGWAWSEVWGWISFNCADRGASVCTASPYRVSRGTSGEQVRFAVADGVLTVAAGGGAPQNLTDPAVDIALCDNEARFFTVVANPPPARPAIRVCMKASYQGAGAAAAGHSNTLRLTLELR